MVQGRSYDSAYKRSRRSTFRHTARFSQAGRCSGRCFDDNWLPSGSRDSDTEEAQHRHLYFRPISCRLRSWNEDNPTTVTPNIDSIARHGTNFNHCVTNQPLCTPSRSCLFTGRYATQTGTWKLGLGFNQGVKTIADAAREHGYTANYIGKWHLAPFNGKADQGEKGFVAPEHRGGFNVLWQASNVLELTTEPYEGTIWSGDGTPIHFKDIYRADFLTGLAVRFLKQEHKEPFLLVISQLEPHHQNDMHAFVPPKRYEEKFRDPFVPHDLRPFPGSWYSDLPGYYGLIKGI